MISKKISPVIVYITASEKSEAERIAKALLKEKLIACANIIPSHSMYWWKEKIEHSNECTVLMKTTTKNYKVIEKRVKAMHSYDCPCIVKIVIEGGNPDYLNWIKETVKS